MERRPGLTAKLDRFFIRFYATLDWICAIGTGMWLAEESFWTTRLSCFTYLLGRFLGSWLHYKRWQQEAKKIEEDYWRKQNAGEAN